MFIRYYLTNILYLVSSLLFRFSTESRLNNLFNGRFLLSDRFIKFALPTRKKAVRLYQNVLNECQDDSYIIIPIAEFSYKSRSVYLTTSFDKLPNNLRKEFLIAGEKISNALQIKAIYIPLNLIDALVIKGSEVWIPHFSRDELRLEQKNISIITYMQMGFPFFFTVSKHGWGGNFKFDEKSKLVAGIVEKPKLQYFLKKVKSENITKISLDNNDTNNDSHNYDVIFFGQLPHDRIISDFEAMSPCDALSRILICCNQMNLKLALKPHPLHKNWNEYYHEYLDKLDFIEPKSHVHKALERTKIVATVNSGVGLEAIMRYQPVLVFGQCDYEEIAIQCFDSSTEIISSHIKSMLLEDISTHKYDNWMQRYFIDNNLLVIENWLKD